jgi:hypothetical protein
MSQVIIQNKGILQIQQGSVSVAGATVFTPENVTSATLNAWYDFSDSSTLFQDQLRTTPVTADGQDLRGAADKSGNGFHLVDTFAGSATYHTSVQNGNDVLRTNGETGAFMENASPMVGAQPLTVFAVGRWRTISPLGGFGAYMVSTQSGTRILMGVANIAGANVGELQYHFGGTVRASSVLPTWTGTAGLWYEVTMEMNGAATNTWVGSVPDLVNDPLGADGNFGTGIRLGGLGGSNEHNWNSDIGEVLIYDGVLSAQDRIDLTASLTTKWATTIA